MLDTLLYDYILSQLKQDIAMVKQQPGPMHFYLCVQVLNVLGPAQRVAGDAAGCHKMLKSSLVLATNLHDLHTQAGPAHVAKHNTQSIKHPPHCTSGSSVC